MRAGRWSRSASRLQGPMLVLSMIAAPVALADQLDIPGPPGSVGFGAMVTVLPNGNIVVVDPDGPVSGIGAVYLYGPNGGPPISTITGIAANDRVGSGGIVVLANGHYLILSPDWHNGGAANAGAVTWADRDSGVSGLVSAENSLVGSTAGDAVGGGTTPITVLPNGNYVVRTVRWDHGSLQDAGAVTWGDGMTGVRGPVSSDNSLVGGHSDAEVGGGGVSVVGTSNYVVATPLWNNGAELNAGAVTWADGAIGVRGTVGTANSLVGTQRDDHIGTVWPLRNGHYVVASSVWDHGAAVDAGAVTWANGNTGLVGTVTTANSLVGATADDRVGSSVTALTNGHYVVTSPGWENVAGGLSKAGAATWCNGTATTTGVVSAANSLVGGSQNDRVGSAGVLALSNGHYVVQSPLWRNGGISAGAATWRNGLAAAPGVVSGTNSLVGTTLNDAVGAVALALPNGHYVLASPSWDNGSRANAGAVTWGHGLGGSAGPLTGANSLIGGTPEDAIGSRLIVLAGGNYVSASPTWDHGSTVDVGAVTLGLGSGGSTGAVSAANSLIGGNANDGVGTSLLALGNGSYLIASPGWNRDATTAVGAVTLVSGTTGRTGVLQAALALTGTTSGDRLGQHGLIAYADGHAAILSGLYDNDGIADAGAVTLIDAAMPLPGSVAPAHSVIGTVALGGARMASAAAISYDPQRQRLAVGRPASNTVSLLRFVDPIFAHRFEGN